ncbi:MauE/DoxX family redox-associated membrane protein [Pedobacter gandavensis]|uniref:Methylamine utilisation protein MauE domain-containing protein n=1 Tax=Pedobacter gandavensis TaxID=2679963 RepID=A0ABR6ETV6_9SPHI|nr:MauE/DoxX family redox-associated membrane protein [Pedobacter gandavensis]MBB2148482.1 hypothetical protein [Pedobacter gandavensis]
METTLRKTSRFHLSEKAKEIIVDIITYLFILLFVYTAYSKFKTIDSFKIILERSPLTGPYHDFIAWAVPIVETLISALLIIPFTKRIGLYASLLLMVLFTGFLTYGILSGSQLPCHCGGVISSLTWQQHIWFNISFIILAILGLYLNKKSLRA